MIILGGDMSWMQEENFMWVKSAVNDGLLRYLRDLADDETVARALYVTLVSEMLRQVSFNTEIRYLDSPSMAIPVEVGQPMWYNPPGYEPDVVWNAALGIKPAIWRYLARLSTHVLPKRFNLYLRLMRKGQTPTDRNAAVRMGKTYTFSLKKMRINPDPQVIMPIFAFPVLPYGYIIEMHYWAEKDVLWLRKLPPRNDPSRYTKDFFAHSALPSFFSDYGGKSPLEVEEPPVADDDTEPT